MVGRERARTAPERLQSADHVGLRLVVDTLQLRSAAPGGEAVELAQVIGQHRLEGRNACDERRHLASTNRLGCIEHLPQDYARLP